MSAELVRNPELYEVAEAYRTLRALLADAVDAAAAGDDDAADRAELVNACLRGMDDDLSARVDALADLDDELSVEAASYEAEAKRLADIAGRYRARAKALDAERGRLKQALAEAMEAAGIERLEGTRHKARFQLNGRPSVTALNAPALVARGLATIKEVDLDRDAIITAWRAGGGELPAELVGLVDVYRGRHLRLS